MVIVTSGLDWKGEPCSISLDGYLKTNLDTIIPVVKRKDFDYIALICGLPGIGKSTFAINIAKYCDPNFTEKNIAFTIDEFIELTSTVPKHSSVVLDESFAGLNTKIGMSKNFIRAIEHLQIIRQRNLFIFLCLPNFFDLGKSVAITRANHLFYCYGEQFGDRGRFRAYDREKKRDLYINGIKYQNYNVVKANYFGTFGKQHVIDPDVYEAMKLKNLISRRDEDDKPKSVRLAQINGILTWELHTVFKYTAQRLSELTGLSVPGIYKALERRKAEMPTIRKVKL